MKKTIYEAPMMEQIQVRFEQNIMSGDAENIQKKYSGAWDAEE